MSESRYPLSWPMPKPRTRHRGTAHFKDYGGKVSIAKAIERLETQLDAIGAASPVLSTNLELRLDGRPRSDRSPPADPGVALYFTLKGRKIALACDRWDRVADNIVAIAKHIEALRGQDRWGVGTIEQAFAGYEALPAPEQWWQVLGIGMQATAAEITEAYRKLARAAHPDTGGSEAAMARLNAARDEAMKNPTARVTGGSQ